MTSSLSQPEKTLAIIKGVGIGLRDTNHPSLYFTVYVSEAAAALQILNWEEAADLIREYDLRDVKDLEGKPCWVIQQGVTIQYCGPWKDQR